MAKLNVSIYDLEGNYLETIYDTSAKELAEQFELDYTGVINHLNGGLLSAGKRWQFKKLFKDSIPNKIGDVTEAVLNSGGKKVHKYYKGKYVASYNSVFEASERCNLDNTAISRIINGRIKTTFGFTFKNANDLDEIK